MQPQDGKTVLFVEDEQGVLRVIAEILLTEGYTVLATLSPSEALANAARHEGPIELLITDIIMPDMNGRELLEELRTTRPEIRCLFLSGYPGALLSDRGVFDEGIPFLSKPFTKSELLAAVKVALE